MIHWLVHVLGIDTQQSPYYDFWSGFATQTSVVVAYVALRWEIRKIRDEERWHEQKEHSDAVRLRRRQSVRPKRR